jgi:hypothetical protein
MTERPGAFQILPFLELSDPEAGWSNVTVTLMVEPLSSQIPNATSSFRVKRWTPWDMPQATVRMPIFNLSFKIQELTLFYTGCDNSSHRLSWLRLPKG